jgi:predicted MPP superfamily phosphohydrolase
MPTRTVRIVHVSDLHASAVRALDQSRLVNALLKDLETLVPDHPADLLVFSGDLAFAGRDEDLVLAQSLLLEPIMQKLQLDTTRTILTPGNHDVARPRINQYLEAGLQRELTTTEAVNRLLDDPDNLREAVDRLANWKTFSEAFYKGTDVQIGTDLSWTVQRAIGDTSIGICSLNSAWRSSGAGEEERGHLLIGDHQIQRSLPVLTQTELKLVVHHHPVSWLAQFDQDGYRREFESIGAVIFTGHEHVPDPLSLVGPRGGAFHSRAGCLYSGADYVNSYSVIDIDLRERKITVGLRTWFPLRGVFDAATDVAPDGVFVADLPTARGTGLAIPYSNVTMSLVAVVQENSVVADLMDRLRPASLDDLIVQPRLYELPFHEVAIILRAHPESKIDRLDVMAQLAEACPVISVVGAPEAGVTSALAWILARVHDADYRRIPLYIRSPKGGGGGVIDQAVRAAAAALGITVAQLSDAQVVLAVDDVAPGDERAVKRLAAYIQNHPTWLFVLGTHSKSVDFISKALGGHDVTSRVAYLAPWGRRELKQLVSLLAKDIDSSVPDRILEVLTEKGLPRNPFLMAALTGVMATNPDLRQLNTTVIVNAYVELLLGRTNFEGGEFLDFRPRSHLLGYIAATFSQRAIQRMNWTEIEALVNDYLVKRDHPNESAGRLISDLIRRRILVEDEVGVGFRHPVLKHLHAAIWMAEGDAFNEFVRENIITNAEIVNHRQGLKRSDRELLETVGLVTSRIIDDVDAKLSTGGLAHVFDHVSDAEPSAESLRSDIEKAGPVVRERLDKAMDDYYERLPGEAPARKELTEALPAPELLLGAVNLLSTVLANSELVDDSALKVGLLKKAIHGWSVWCAYNIDSSEDAERIADVIRRILLKPDASAQDRERVEKLARLIVFLAATFMAMAAMSGQKVAGILDKVMEDAEFMASTMHAVLCVLISADMPGWPGRLRSLYQQHGGHPFVSDLTYRLALSKSLTTTDADASDLQEFLADFLTANATGTSRKRAQKRSEILQQLQRSRIQSKARGVKLDLLSGEPTSDDQPE